MRIDTTLRPIMKGMRGCKIALISNSPPDDPGELELPRRSLICWRVAESMLLSILPQRCDDYTPYGMLVSDKQ